MRAGRVGLALLALALLGLALAVAAPASAEPRLTPIGDFELPVHVTAPPGDGSRLFVVEKPGDVTVVSGGTAKTFLDIRPEVDPLEEKGLLSIAFAPDYATSRRFYVYYSAKDPALFPGSRVRVTEYLRSATDPDVADPSTRRVLLDIPHPTHSNHNGGQLQFGPDGLLYAATGDGGGANDPFENAQDRYSLLGKVLRIDPTPSATLPYTIPAGNPWADGVDGAPEVFAYGLRNPWRFSFDRQTGDLVLGDVGQGALEEIDFLASGTGAGANFGWDCFEGTMNTPSADPDCTPPEPADHVRPVYEYPNPPGDQCSSVTGGYVVRDPALPSLLGRYLYADLCDEVLRSITLPSAGDHRVEPLRVPSAVSFGEDSCGHVYVASIGGEVSRVDEEQFVPCPTSSPPKVDPPGQAAPGQDAPGQGQDPPPSGGSTADTRPPGLVAARAKRQNLIRNTAVYFAATCDEPCTLRTEANVRLRAGRATRKWAFLALARVLAAEERPRLKLKLPKAMRAEVAALMARGARPLAKVVVVARDAAGNETRRTIFVRVAG